MEEHIQSITYQASLDVLGSVRELLNQAGKDVGLDKKKMYGLCLAVDEIATNIILHGYQEAGIKDGTFDVIIHKMNDKLAVTIVDKGQPFNPLEHLVPTEEDLNSPLETRPIGGLGVLIARQSVDELKYEFSDNHNKNIFIVKYDKK